jgi:MerC mercury resistance protein
MDWLANSWRLDGRDWDRWGIVASALCVVHCIATPIIALALPGIAATEGVTHGLLGVAIVVFASLAFIPGCRTHGKHRVLLLGMIGVVLIWTALLLPQALADDGLRDAITVVGGLAMVAAHVFNVILCRRCTERLATRKAGIKRTGARI